MSTKEKILSIITEYLGLDNPVTENLDLRGDLNASEEEIDELFLTVEEEFSVETTKEERDRVKTVGDLINLIKDKMDEIEE